MVPQIARQATRLNITTTHFEAQHWHFSLDRTMPCAMLWRWLYPLLAMTSLTACHSPGMYGYSRAYSATDEETSALQGSQEYDPVMANRRPQKWRGKPVSLFGVVTERHQGSAGAADLRLSVRTLEARNLCESADESTCRVTVSEREHAVVHALVKLSGDDDVGQLSVGQGSLLRIVGKISDAAHRDDGAPIFQVNYYRHWPRNYFVTSKDREHMRR